VALLVAMVWPQPTSAGLRDRIRRNDDRNEPSAAAPASVPPAGLLRRRAYWRDWVDSLPPQVKDDWADEAPLRVRGYYRRNGLPAPAAGRGPVASGTRTPTTAPRNLVEKSDAAAEQLPALHEPTLATGAASRVEPTSATEPLPHLIAPLPAEARDIHTAGSQWPQVRREENQEWREQQIRELEARVEALEAAQAAKSKPLPGPAE
jgi:hypothetical protein